jgi:hypothetical protein
VTWLLFKEWLLPRALQRLLSIKVGRHVDVSPPGPFSNNLSHAIPVFDCPISIHHRAVASRTGPLTRFVVRTVAKLRDQGVRVGLSELSQFALH